MGNNDVASSLIAGGADTTVLGFTALHHACQYNQTLVVEQILTQSKANEIDCQDYSGNTPLMVASSCGHAEIVKLLLEAGAQMNISNFSDYPSLHLPPHQIPLPGKARVVRGSALDIAVITGHAEAVSQLLQCGAKVHNIYYLFRSIALKLVQEDNTNTANSLLQSVSMAKEATNSTAISDWEKYSAVIRLLFSHDRDLIGRVQCTNPSTLYMACAFGVVEMVSLLIELGINVSDLYRTDNSGSSYWCSLVAIISGGSLLSEAASKQASSDVASLLCQVDWPKYSRVITLLAENGLDVNHQDGFGSFALAIASREGHAHLVRLLWQCGPDVNLQDKAGVSSLIEATSSGHLEICRLLLRYRAKVDLLDSKGWSALMVAVAAGNMDLVLLLLKRGAQINLQDESGTSSLMLSCLAGYTHVTKVLLGHGAKVNLQNVDGITALMVSCYNGHTEIVELLMGHGGADMSIVTSIGMTALRVSTDNGHKDITKLLIDHGASDHRYTRKRPLSTRDLPFVCPRIAAHAPDNSPLETRLDRIEHILQTLLQLKGAHQATTPTCKSGNAELKPTLSDCLRILITIAHDWKLIGTLLNVEQLETIEYDNMRKSKHCLRDMLHQWLVRVSPPPTWEELAEAVEHTDQTIARKIRRTC